MSRQRKLIMSVIQSSSEHMTVDTIYQKAKRILPSLSLGTVYRNLGLMVEAGEIRRVTMLNAPDRFDRVTDPHEHLICQHCGVLSDIVVSDLKSYIEKRTGIEILGYDLNLKYICENCRRKDGG